MEHWAQCITLQLAVEINSAFVGDTLNPSY